MTTSYAPEVELQRDGTLSLDYARAHARRRADAHAALAAVTDPSAALLTIARCTCKRRLASVYATPHGRVVVTHRVRHLDLELRELRRVLGEGTLRVSDKALDLLDASDDVDLEARCYCGPRLIDRAWLQEQLASGERRPLVPRRSRP